MPDKNNIFRRGHVFLIPFVFLRIFPPRLLIIIYIYSLSFYIKRLLFKNDRQHIIK